MNWVSHRAVLPSAEGVAPTEEAPALLSEVRLKHENKAPGFSHKYITKTTNAKYWGRNYNHNLPQYKLLISQPFHLSPG